MGQEMAPSKKMSLSPENPRLVHLMHGYLADPSPYPNGTSIDLVVFVGLRQRE